VSGEVCRVWVKVANTIDKRFTSGPYHCLSTLRRFIRTCAYFTTSNFYEPSLFSSIRPPAQPPCHSVWDHSTPWHSQRWVTCEPPIACTPPRRCVYTEFAVG